MKDEKIINGSALILAVVLVSLLAIVGVLFIMVARVDKISASSIAENRQLNHAVDTVIAKISQRLAWDVPRADTNGRPIGNYYDYPDSYNPWLASTEPVFISDNNTPADISDDIYKWPQISDVTGYLRSRPFAVQYVKVHPPANRTVILEYPEIILDNTGRLYSGNPDDGRLNSELRGQSADADGDGIADSKWIELDDITSGKGKTVYAAIRIVDNLGMINVNTAYRFEPNDLNIVAADIDGSSQMQIDLMDLNDTIIYKTDLARNPTGRPHLNYQNDVIWNTGEPDRIYLPFDISDELDLRYRYCIPSLAIGRLKNLWVDTIGGPTHLYDTSTGSIDYGLHDWCPRVTEPFYADHPDRRHFLTNYNIDRVINPDGLKMVNVNKAAGITDANSIRNAIHAAFIDVDPNMGSADAIAAQIAVNLVDFIDDDNDVISTIRDASNNIHYGFERPCVYISELAQSFYNPNKFDVNLPFNLADPNLRQGYAIEIHKPYFEDNIPKINDWRILIGGNVDSNIPIRWTGTNQYHVLTNQYLGGVIYKDVIDSNFVFPPDGAARIAVTAILIWPAVPGIDSYDVYLDPNFNSVKNASDPNISPGQGRQPSSSNSYIPSLFPNTIYFWRIDNVKSGVVVGRGEVRMFKTIESDPNAQNANVTFTGNNLIELQRRIADTNEFITVDSVRAPFAQLLLDPNYLQLRDPNHWWSDPNGYIIGHSFQRDISKHKCIRRLWDNLLSKGGSPSLGGVNNYVYANLADPLANLKIQAHPENKPFTNIGEIGMILRRSAYSENPATTIGPADTEYTTRLNLADINYQQIFKYLTVFDPSEHIFDPNRLEMRIKGRININTAPWYVIAQLPWVSQRKNSPPNYIPGALAHAIVAYRDKTLIPGRTDPNYINRGGNPGFASIGELENVFANDPNYRDYSIDYYNQHNPGIPANDLAGFPDLTPGGVVGDGAPDDFEERDVIFSRISNLVTVRSDVYTAYILVRIGANGPQKRVIAILDRSNVHSPADKVKVIAVQQVPEAR